LTDTSLENLENFQCTLGKRILRLSRSHSNTSVLIGLDWPSMRDRVLINYLKRVITADEDKLSSLTLKFFAGIDVSKLTIVEQCRYLEGVYRPNFTGEVLTSIVSQRDLQKRVLTADKEVPTKGFSHHQSLKLSLFPSCQGSRYGTWL
jgi:hypothetical protein